MVLVFGEQQNGVFKKPTLEAVGYAGKLAQELGTDCAALILGSAAQPEELGNYGANKILHCNNEKLNAFSSIAYTKIIVQAVQDMNVQVIVFANTVTAKSIAPRLSAKLKAGLVSGAVSLPDLSNGFTVKKSVFSGKAFANVSIQSPIKIITLTANSFPPVKVENTAEISDFTCSVDDADFKTTLIETNTVTGTIPLSEAELVVSGGRGMKGPENWGMLEEMADILGATLACSRPVADSHWRPHHEHVGQTGGTIRPNLYIAVGISGAIQHLAGVNGSKTIVVINKDPEAPFFKAADYGVLGDAFEIVPKLNEALKRFKASQN